MDRIDRRREFSRARNTPTPGNHENGHGKYSRHSGGKGGGRKGKREVRHRTSKGSERIDIDNDEKTQDRNDYKPDDESAGMEEETNPHDEEENIAQPQRSPKRIKKLKTDREAHTPRE